MAKKRSTRTRSAHAPRTSGAKPAAAWSISVVVKDSHLPRIEAVASQLRARGMKVDSVLDAVGQITGSYHEPLDTLRDVEGVSAVEEQPTMSVPPPDSKIQ